MSRNTKSLTVASAVLLFLFAFAFTASAEDQEGAFLDQISQEYNLTNISGVEEKTIQSKTHLIFHARNEQGIFLIYHAVIQNNTLESVQLVYTHAKDHFYPDAFVFQDIIHITWQGWLEFPPPPPGETLEQPQYSVFYAKYNGSIWDVDVVKSGISFEKAAEKSVFILTDSLYSYIAAIERVKDELILLRHNNDRTELEGVFKLAGNSRIKNFSLSGSIINLRWEDSGKEYQSSYFPSTRILLSKRAIDKPAPKPVILPPVNFTLPENITGNATVTRTINATPKANITFHIDKPLQGNIIVEQPEQNPETETKGLEVPLTRYLVIEADESLKGNLTKATLSIDYSDISLPNVDESSLKMYWFNTSIDEWQVLQESWVDINNKIVYGNTTHFSTFGISGQKPPEPSPSSPGGGSSGGGSGGGSSSGKVGVTRENGCIYVFPSHAKKLVEEQGYKYCSDTSPSTTTTTTIPEMPEPTTTTSTTTTTIPEVAKPEPESGISALGKIFWTLLFVAIILAVFWMIVKGRKKGKL